LRDVPLDGLKPEKELAMKKTTLKKLTLSRETLQSLTAEQAKGALGPNIVRQPEVPWTSDSAKVCCA
jgi:hypothetical protein